MKKLSIDIEVFSSADLSKTGVYKYAEASDFTILLFGYAIDDSDVQVIDLAQGEQLPEEICAALTDERVTKWAFNAAFERVCLSRYLGLPTGEYLEPAQWRCSMIWSAYLGLPLSLQSVGMALGLEKQKLTEGKDLIKYFCQPCAPTKTNGQRTRNLPADAPDKWTLFKAYNLRDVETEMEIQKRLSKFPVPDMVWDEYHLDQEINDRGIALDMTLVRNAIAMDAQSREELSRKMQELTMLDNPNSVAQMKQWLADNGLAVDSLGKKEVALMLKNAPEPLRTVLMLRQQLAKSSVKKYQAMENAACADNRARGMFQFYGANRSGRFCLTGDHEILTPDGWIRLDEWSGGMIACWSPAGEIISFSESESVSFPYDGQLYHYHDARIDQSSTPEHKMYARRNRNQDWRAMTVEEMAKSRPMIPLYGYRVVNKNVCANQFRVLIMTQADGYYTPDGQVRFHFKKARKVERCKALLRKCEIMFTCRENEKSSTTQIDIPARAVPLWLRQFKDKQFRAWMLDENADVFFDELPHWDGYRPAPNSIQYCTSIKQNADFVQAFAHMSGRTAVCRLKRRSENYKDRWKDAYVVDIWENATNAHEIVAKPTMEPFCGKVYCAVTKSGYFLVRRNGKVWVTGNSGRLIQLQNLPQNHMGDLEEARAVIRSGDYEAARMLYDSVPDVLSELIRTAFVPRPGCTFFVADFSAIEARVIAWLAGEEWRQQVFADGKDIYCASACQMFGVPVEKHGINGHLRQKGKIAELALGYGGSVGALKAMGALEMGLQEEELKPLVDAWRSANPKIVKLWWEVDEAVMTAIRKKTTTKTHGILFSCQSGMLFITLPSGRQLAYAKPRIGENQFGSPAATYMGMNTARQWDRLESYGPKFVENIVQAISRDILCYAMQTLRCCSIVAHVHDELIIEADPRMSLEAICEQMARTPPWAPGLQLRADGYVTDFYKKD